MNELGTGILKIMEKSSLGRMSVYILSKQTRDLGIDLDTISKDEAIVLVGRLKMVLPFFLADENFKVITNIRKYVN
ncbi:MAG: hypothetical protein KAR56_01245 [Thermoplasmata archaeon]|nr:hypothetical protein [Thermoplasmata archaeon]